jgi:hypothetical protein
MPSGSRRQKRKRRQASRAGSSHGPGQRGGNGAGGAYARARAKDDAARRTLKPLAEGERPTAVTVAAIVAFLLGASNLLLFAAGVEVQGQKPNAFATLFQSGLMLVAAWGMWGARYWAVLGMQVILGFVIVIFAVLAVTARDVAAVLISIAVVAAAGTLFWFLIKAMARLQMPERRM